MEPVSAGAGAVGSTLLDGEGGGAGWRGALQLARVKGYNDGLLGWRVHGAGRFSERMERAASAIKLRKPHMLMATDPKAGAGGGAPGVGGEGSGGG